MPSVKILEEAVSEAIEAAVWYEGEKPGLGIDFSKEVEATIELLEEGLLPQVAANPGFEKFNAKRVLLRRFPYDIITITRNEEVLIIAVAHHSRKPGYWRERAKGQQ